MPITTAAPVRSRRRLTAALVGAVLLAAPACGVTNDGSAGAGDEPTEAPPPVSGEAAVEALERALRTTTTQPRSSFEAEATVDAPTGPERLGVAGAVDRKVPRIEVDLTSTDRGVKLRLDRDDAWLKLEGAATEALPEGVSWIHVTKADDVAGIDFDFERDVPYDLLYYLRGATDVRGKGTDRVAGVPVRTFTFTAADDVVDRAPAERRAAVADLIRATGDSQLEVTGEVAIDGDGRVRRLHLRGEVRPADPIDGDLDAEITIEWDLTLDDFGAEVDVEPPPAAQVTDVDDDPELRAVLEELNLD